MTPLIEQIKQVHEEFEKDLETPVKTLEKLEEFRVKYQGRKGKLSTLFSQLGNVPAHQKPEIGQLINHLKDEISQSYEKLKKTLSVQIKEDDTQLDLYLPGEFFPVGSLHPLTQTIQEVKQIFQSIGFSVAYGPEIDDDYHNFEALNIPKHHPARDMQDTFYIDEDLVLRTHTSNVQIHLMEQRKPPLKFIVPGRVYRKEAISVRSYCLFHQVEGLYVDTRVSFAELKGTLEYFVNKFFGKDIKSRFRPSFFPFTEPSAEVDISCLFCKGKGCSTCKKSGWLEILGCGMVNPAVLKNVGYDPETWKGYAFGMGIERLAMLKYRIDDIRLFYSGDVRFLRQF